MTTQNQRTRNRIEFHRNLLVKQEGILAKSAPDSAAHKRTSVAMAKNMALIASLEALAVSQVEKQERAALVQEERSNAAPKKRGPKGPTGPQRGTRFDIEIGEDLVGFNEDVVSAA